jgi:hypothetical protein
MEDLHRTHKETPFGWVQWLQQALDRKEGVSNAARKARTGTPAWPRAALR